MTDRLTYAAVTPVRNEAENLPRLAASLVAQSVTPAAWVIVENGSTDDTRAIAERLASEHSWISVVESTPSTRPDRSSAYMRAVDRGLAALGQTGDLVVKLDADVSLEPDYFERLIGAFEDDPQLGIASGTLFELHHGVWREQILLGDHVWGPTRTYRRACLEAVRPLDHTIAQAVIDETKAHLAGWRTATLHHLPFRHHRPEGSTERSPWHAWMRDGAAAHYAGYRVSYLVARALYRMRRNPAALALLAGYMQAAVRRKPRYEDVAVREAVRRSQRARNFLRAVRSRLARRHGHDPSASAAHGV
jgi:glycosyltransferase involved in cell wall biosynthesis